MPASTWTLQDNQLQRCFRDQHEASCSTDTKDIDAVESRSVLDRSLQAVRSLSPRRRPMRWKAKSRLFRAWPR